MPDYTKWSQEDLNREASRILLKIVEMSSRLKEVNENMNDPIMSESF